MFAKDDLIVSPISSLCRHRSGLLVHQNVIVKMTGEREDWERAGSS